MILSLSYKLVKETFNFLPNMLQYFILDKFNFSNNEIENGMLETKKISSFCLFLFSKQQTDNSFLIEAQKEKISFARFVVCTCSLKKQD